jgi:hypothetical protein
VNGVKYAEPGRCGPSWSKIEQVFSEYDSELTLVTFVEAEYDFNIAKSSHEIEGEWIGIVHDPLDTHKYYKNHGKRRNHLRGRGFRKSLERCKGLFFLTKTECDKWRIALDSLGYHHIKCDYGLHPIQNHEHRFSWDAFLENKDKRIIQTGHWLRIPYSIFKLDTPHEFKKTIVPYDDRQRWYLRLFGKTDGVRLNKHEMNSVDKVPLLSFEEYVTMLTENILYMELCEASANNTVLDAILMNTPLIVNKLDGVVEYLGEDYPLYFENRDEVADMLLDTEKLIETHIYLREMDKTRFSLENFGRSFFNSKIMGNA